MKKLILIFILFTAVCCDENGNSSNTVSTTNQSQANDNTAMINMIKEDIEKLNMEILVLTEEINKSNEEIDNINNTDLPMPTPVNIPVCCDVNNIDPQLQLLIVDVNEVILGEVLGFIGDSPTKPWTVIEINGKKYVFTVEKDNFLRGSTDRTYFENNDCTGQAYIPKSIVDDSFVAIVGSVAPADASSDPANDTLYEPDFNSLVNTTYNSSWDSEAMSCDASTNTEDLYEAIQITNLPSLFEPPYTIQ